ncbi:MAG: hypothetical protein JWM68_2479 [Verrucomicrobiales bacterium]|nr:hypothetical protein [Verrucomicrobiales bacterium]
MVIKQSESKEKSAGRTQTSSQPRARGGCVYGGEIFHGGFRSWHDSGCLRNENFGWARTDKNAVTEKWCFSKRHNFRSPERADVWKGRSSASVAFPVSPFSPFCRQRKSPKPRIGPISCKEKLTKCRHATISCKRKLTTTRKERFHATES